MRLKRRLAAVLAAVLPLVLLGTTAPAVAGDYPSPGPSWIAVKLLTCGGTLDWWGGVAGFESVSGAHPFGTVRMCWELWKVESEDPDFDLYAVRATSEWANDSGYAGGEATMFQHITSSVSADDPAYAGASASISRSPLLPCYTFDVDVPIWAFTFPVEISMCPGGKMNQYFKGNSGAGWYSPQTQLVPQAQSIFWQKIPKTSRPCFTMELGVPQYDTTRIAVPLTYVSTAHIRYYDYQYCVPGGTPGPRDGGLDIPSDDPAFTGRAEPAMVYDQSNASMKIYRWVSDGDAFGRLTDYQSGTFHLSNVGNRVASGDVNGDGLDDIVMAYQNSDGTFSFHVFSKGNKWLGTWYTSGTFDLNNVAGRLVVADFTGDGKAEPAMAYYDADGTQSIYRWQSTGSSFTRATDYNGTGIFRLSRVGDRVAAADVTGDGKADIVEAYQNPDGTFSYYVWKDGLTSLGVWYTSGIFDLNNVAGRLVVDDFTGDGKAEPAMAYYHADGTQSIYRWQSTGGAFARAADYIGTGIFRLSNVGDRIASGDVTGDGVADVVMAYQNDDGTSSLHVFKSGSSWAGRWYTGGQYNLGNVNGRLILGNWY